MSFLLDRVAQTRYLGLEGAHIDLAPPKIGRVHRDEVHPICGVGCFLLEEEVRRAHSWDTVYDQD